MRYRVTGLAAEAAFFTVLSVPPLIFALAGAIGYVTQSFSPDQVDHVRTAILDLASRFLTDSAVDERVISPTINDVLRGGRFDVISVGFVLSLWSGSRAMHVFVDTITIMHGLGGHRGIVKTRALSFSLYLLAIVTGVIALPLVVAGPRIVHELLPARADFLVSFYWPTVVVVSICFLATLYHVSIPVRTKWRINLPGATFALAVWLLGSFLLRQFLTADGRRLALHLRPPRRADRRAALALHPLHRRPGRSGAQRVVRHRLPAAAHRARPDGAGPAPAPPSGPRGRGGVGRGRGRGLDSRRAVRDRPSLARIRRTP